MVCRNTVGTLTKWSLLVPYLSPHTHKMKPTCTFPFSSYPQNETYLFPLFLHTHKHELTCALPFSTHPQKATHLCPLSLSSCKWNEAYLHASFLPKPTKWSLPVPYHSHHTHKMKPACSLQLSSYPQDKPTSTLSLSHYTHKTKPTCTLPFSSYPQTKAYKFLSSLHIMTKWMNLYPTFLHMPTK